MERAWGHRGTQGGSGSGGCREHTGRSWLKVDPVCTGSSELYCVDSFSGSIEDVSFEEEKDTIRCLFQGGNLGVKFSWER